MAAVFRQRGSLSRRHPVNLPRALHVIAGQAAEKAETGKFCDLSSPPTPRPVFCPSSQSFLVSFDFSLFKGLCKDCEDCLLSFPHLCYLQIRNLLTCRLVISYIPFVRHHLAPQVP